MKHSPLPWTTCLDANGDEVLFVAGYSWETGDAPFIILAIAEGDVELCYWTWRTSRQGKFATATDAAVVWIKETSS